MDQSVEFHKTGFGDAVEVQDVLVASGFRLDLCEVVCQYFQDPFMGLFLGAAQEDFTCTRVDVWDVEVTATDDYSIRVVSSCQDNVGERLFKFMEGLLAFIWWLIEGSKVNLLVVTHQH